MSRDNTYLRHMLDAIERIKNHISGATFVEFVNNFMMIDAVIRQIEILGEAAIHLSDEFQNSHPEIPFASMIGMRNKLIHGYDDVELEVVWKTYEEDLDNLKKVILGILERK